MSENYTHFDETSVLLPQDSHRMAVIAEIENNDIFFSQLQKTQDIPLQFLPAGKEYCLVLIDRTPETGDLSYQTTEMIRAFAHAHIADPKHARWLLVHVWLPNALKPQSTLVCFIQHFSPNALVDNTEGAGVANQVLLALQGLDGLVTTNVNYELIRKMSSKFGVLFGGSFADLAQRLKVYSLKESVDKNKRAAEAQGLLSPVSVPSPSLGLRAGAVSGAPVLEDD